MFPETVKAMASRKTLLIIDQFPEHVTHCILVLALTGLIIVVNHTFLHHLFNKMFCEESSYKVSVLSNPS